MAPLGRSNTDYSTPSKKSGEGVPGLGIHHPSHLRSPEVTDSPSITWMKSIDSVPVTGIFPLGSLRINEPRDQDTMVMDLATPLTIPDGTPEPANERVFDLLKDGDVLILDDLPSTFTVGCDTMSFSTTQQFLGFRDIPPGAHLFWVAPSELTSSRSAYWIFTPDKEEFAPGRVHVKQWDKFNEVLNEPASAAEERFQRENLDKIFVMLSPYQFHAPTTTVPPPGQSSQSDPLPRFLSNATIWYQLTLGITPALLDRITENTNATVSWPVNTTDQVTGGDTSPEEARLYANSSSHQLRFTFPINGHLFDTKSSGSDRTQQALDPTSFILNSLPDENDLTGELQFAFLTGTHLGNFSCLEQWWHYTTRLIFRSYRLAVSRPQLTRNLIQTLHAQLVYNDRYLESSILDAMPTNAVKLKKALTVYKSRLNEELLSLGDRCTPAQNAVGQAFSALESWLGRFGWDLRGDYVRSGNLMLEDGEVVHAELDDFESEDERGEYKPVVVEMDEDGRPTHLVSV